MASKIKRYGPLLLWMGVIYYFSSRGVIQATSFDLIDFIFKKTAHLVEYALLYFLAFRAFSQPNQFQKAFIFGLFYAFTDEIHQMFTPGRTAKVRDILIFDTLGLIIGFFAIQKIKLVNLWSKK